MASANAILRSILMSSSILLGIVAMIVSTIFLLKKGNQYDKHMRRLMIAMLIIAFVFSLYLLLMAFVFGNPHPSASPVPLS